MKVNVPHTNLPRVVIIGGGFAGITLARKLRRQPLQVIMFDKHNYHTFQPLLYQVATGGLEPDSIAFPIRKLFKRYPNFTFRMAEVERIDPDNRLVCTSIGEITYDYLVIATGSRTNYSGLDQIESEAIGLKDIPEALDLRSLILQNFEKATLTTDLEQREALMNYVVVGAGPTGVELAGALAELKRHVLPKDYPELDIRRMQIHLLEAYSEVLGTMKEKASANALEALEDLGINVWLNTKVESYDGTKVITHTGKELSTATLIWTAGVIGNEVKGLGEMLVKGNRYKVDEFNRIKGSSRIFAIGDIALMRSDAYPQGHPMVAQAAIQQAALLAKNIMNLIRQKAMKPFSYKDKGTMATIGRNKAVVDLKKYHFKGSFAWFLWMAVHLFSLAGFRNKLVVFINWFWNYVTYDRGTRLIIRPFEKKAGRKAIKKFPDLGVPGTEEGHPLFV